MIDIRVVAWLSDAVKSFGVTLGQTLLKRAAAGSIPTPFAPDSHTT